MWTIFLRSIQTALKLLFVVRFRITFKTENVAMANFSIHFKLKLRRKISVKQEKGVRYNITIIIF